MSKILFPLLTIVFLLVSPPPTQAQELSWENLLLETMKLDKSFDYEANVDSYMQKFRSDIWERYHNDEFELEDKRQETIKMMRARVAAFPSQEEFVIPTTFSFENYNFKKQKFPMQPFSESTYYNASDSGSGTLPYMIKLFFSNPEKVSGLSMGKAPARGFIVLRKDQYGDINRTVYATVHAKVINLKGKDTLEAKITSVEVYGDQRKTKLLQKY